MAYLIAVIALTLSVLEGHSPITSLFNCDIFALVLLFLDLILLLHVAYFLGHIVVAFLTAIWQ